MKNITNTCTKCSIEHPQDFFVKSTITKSGYRGICKTCFNAYYAKRRVEKYEKVREYERKFHKARRLKYEYNITEDDLAKLQEDQAGCCKICYNKTRLVIDHCHNSGKVRGLLCNNCNLALGLLKDNINILNSAVNYLKESTNDTKRLSN